VILALALALDPRLARRVGVLTLAVLALTSAGFVFLSGRLALGTPLRFRVVFRHVAGLTERAPLVVGGTQVGRVAAISPLPHGAPGSLADGAGVVVTIEIRPEDAAKVPGDAAIFIALRGALSDRYLEVAPPAGRRGRRSARAPSCAASTRRRSTTSCSTPGPTSPRSGSSSIRSAPSSPRSAPRSTSWAVSGARSPAIRARSAASSRSPPRPAS